MSVVSDVCVCECSASASDFFSFIRHFIFRYIYILHERRGGLHCTEELRLFFICCLLFGERMLFAVVGAGFIRHS